jgi:ABC-type oligopeptide transport system substrate-binding subunit
VVPNYDHKGKVKKLKTNTLKKQLIVWGFVILALSLVNACNKQEDENENFVLETEEKPTIKAHPGYVRIPIEGVIPTIDPGLTVDMASIEITEQLFLGLTDYDPNTYKVTPELAERWTVSEDGTKYTFHLRKNANWSNGEPVTSHDIVWAIQRNINPDTNCPYSYMLGTLKNANDIMSGKITDPSQIGVRAVSDKVVEFELEHPAAFFPAMVGLWIYRPLPQKCIKQFGDSWTDHQNIQTNGSYMLADWKKGKVMILKKNPNYYDIDNVRVPEIHYIIIPESSVGLVMYENDELDIVGGEYMRIPLTEIPRIKIDPKLRKEYTNEPSFCTYYFGYNTKRKPVDNPLVRKAISAAIDRRLLIEVITKGDQDPATTFTRPPIFGSVPISEGIGVSFNPKQARKWLAEAGFPNGKGMPEIILMHNTSEDNAMIAKAVQTCVKYYLNIDIIIKNKEWTAYVDEIEQPRTPHIFRLGWCADYPDANNWLNDVFHPFNSSNYIGWANKEYAELMDRAQRINDQDERQQLYKRAEEILCQEETAIIPLYFYTAPYLVKKWVKGWYHMAMGGQHIRNWSIAENAMIESN